MKSQLPKVLHRICGASMLDHVLAAARELSPAELIVVVGHGRRQVAAHLARHAPDVRVVVQERQGGTGHAVRTVTETVGLGQGTVVVTYGDTPLLRGSTLAALVREHAAEQVEYEVFYMTHRILDIIAKYKKEQHITDEVRPSPVQEHRSKQCEEHRDGSNSQTRQDHLLACQGIDKYLRLGNNIMSRQDLARNGGISIGKQIVMPPVLPIEEHK